MFEVVMSSLSLLPLCNCQFNRIWCCFSFCIAFKSDFSWVFFFFFYVWAKKKTVAALLPTFFIFQQKRFSLYSYDKERGRPGVTRAAAYRVAGIHLQGETPDFKVDNLSMLMDGHHLESKCGR